VRDLAEQCETNGARLFGRDVAAQLKDVLEKRTRATEGEVEAIEQAYPNFTDAVHRRYLTLVALGLVEAEYRRHLTEATISVDVFEDLDAQRRVIAARFTRKPELDRALDMRGLVRRFPFMAEFPALRLCVKPYLAFPGQRIELAGRGKSCAFWIALGEVDIHNGKTALVLGPGDFFARKALFGGCRRATTATSKGYANMLKVDWRGLETLMNAYPALRKRIEMREQRSRPAHPQTVS